MRPDEFHQCAAEGVRDVDDQPVFVAAEVEDHPVVADEVHSCAELPLDVVGIPPAAFVCNGEPGANRTLSLRMTFPELLECAAGDHLHA
jgi:hypothetical protein